MFRYRDKSRRRTKMFTLQEVGNRPSLAGLWRGDLTGSIDLSESNQQNNLDDSCCITQKLTKK